MKTSVSDEELGSSFVLRTGERHEVTIRYTGELYVCTDYPEGEASSPYEFVLSWGGTEIVKTIDDDHTPQDGWLDLYFEGVPTGLQLDFSVRFRNEPATVVHRSKVFARSKNRTTNAEATSG